MNDIHICMDYKSRKSNMFWVVHTKTHEKKLVPISELEKWKEDKNWEVAICRQGYCFEPAIILDHLYPYYQDHNYCQHCAEVLLDYEFKGGDTDEKK